MKKIIEVLILIGGLMMVVSCANPSSVSDDTYSQNTNNTEVQNGGDNGTTDNPNDGTTDPQNGGGNGTQNMIEFTNHGNGNNMKIEGLSSAVVSSVITFYFNGSNYTITKITLNGDDIDFNYLEFGNSGGNFIEILNIGCISHIYVNYVNGVSNATLVIQTN